MDYGWMDEILLFPLVALLSIQVQEETTLKEDNSSPLSPNSSVSFVTPTTHAVRCEIWQAVIWAD